MYCAFLRILTGGGESLLLLGIYGGWTEYTESVVVGAGESLSLRTRLGGDLWRRLSGCASSSAADLRDP